MNLVFETYINRSGSTYLANLLSRDSRILVCPEAEILVDLFLRCPEENFSEKKYRQLQKAIKSDKKLTYWGLHESEIQELRSVQTNFEAFLIVLNAYRQKIQPAARFIVFKASVLIYFYEQIRNIRMPGTTVYFLSIIRDPRAVFYSQYHTWSEIYREYMERNPVYVVRDWKKFFKSNVKYAENNDFCTIYYEDIIEDTEQTVQQVYKTINLDYVPDIKQNTPEYAGRIPKDQISMHRLINHPPDANRIDRWKHNLNPVHIRIVERIMKKSGSWYSVDLLNPPVSSIKRFLIHTWYFTAYVIKKIYVKIKVLVGRY